MPKLKRLFYRAKIEVSEMNILRGILSQIQQLKGSHEN
jgi:tRNA C32,U32 (ribose-2'-O)-methylase TrmJ